MLAGLWTSDNCARMLRDNWRRPETCWISPLGLVWPPPWPCHWPQLLWSLEFLNFNVDNVLNIVELFGEAYYYFSMLKVWLEKPLWTSIPISGVGKKPRGNECQNSGTLLVTLSILKWGIYILLPVFPPESGTRLDKELQSCFTVCVITHQF